MKRIALVAFLVLLVSGMAATPAVAAPGPPDHPEWWFDTWNVPGLWAGGARGQGITIGEIDTGVNAGLPELSANVLPGTDFGDLGGNGQTDRDTDDFGHGTAMASLMVAHDGQDNILGMAPDARVLPVAVPITGTTDDAGDQAGQLLLQAIHWAADHGAKIISMSLGSQRSASDLGRSCPATEQSAVDYALSKGAIVVASGGNSGDNGSPIEDPGVCLGVVSVGAVDNTNTVPVWSSKHPYLTVAAPGVDVPSISKIPGEAFFGDGTSQAAALTSAGLAVIWSKYPQLTNRQVVARLLATLDLKHTTRDTAVGYGVINIGSAVTANVAPDAPNPVYDGVAPFLAQDKALAKAVADPKVKPATTRKDFPGTFAVTPAPGPLMTGPGLGGIVGGGIGLIAVVFLTIGGARRRRLVASVGYAVDPPTEPIPIITFGAGSPSPSPSLSSPLSSSPWPSASASAAESPFASAAPSPSSSPTPSAAPSPSPSPSAAEATSLFPVAAATFASPAASPSDLERNPTTAGLPTTAPPTSQPAESPASVMSPPSALSPTPADSPTESESTIGESSRDGAAEHTASADSPERAGLPVDSPGPAALPVDLPERTALPVDLPERTALPVDSPERTALPDATPGSAAFAVDPSGPAASPADSPAQAVFPVDSPGPHTPQSTRPSPGPDAPAVDSPEPAASQIVSNWHAAPPVDSPEPTVSRVDTPEAAQPLIGESSARPMTGVDSPAKSETTVGESSQDDAPSPAAVNSPGEPGLPAEEPAHDATTRPDATARSRADASAGPAATTADSPSATIPPTGESSMTRVDSPGGSRPTAGESAHDDPAQPATTTDDSPGEPD